MAQSRKDLCFGFRVSNAAPCGELFLCLVDISEQLELCHELRIGGHIHEDGRTATVLGEKDGAPPALHLPDHPCDIGAKFRERADIFV